MIMKVGVFMDIDVFMDIEIGLTIGVLYAVLLLLVNYFIDLDYMLKSLRNVLWIMRNVLWIIGFAYFLISFCFFNFNQDASALTSEQWVAIILIGAVILYFNTLINIAVLAKSSALKKTIKNSLGENRENTEEKGGEI